MSFRGTPEIIAKIRETAKTLGWAVGEHGSMKRDVDLIVAPWTTSAVPYHDVIDAIAKECGLVLLGSSTPEMPHSRRCQLFLQPYAQPVNDDGRGKGAWVPQAFDVSFIGGPAPTREAPTEPRWTWGGSWAEVDNAVPVIDSPP